MADSISKMPHLAPGTRIKVGQYSTKVVRYLSEGGFSHVYIAKLDIPIKGSDVAVLKRIIAPDKAALSAIRTEVETMKKLRGHRHIVMYYDSHATELKGGGFEVYVLMEYCAAGGLIDFMNTRLQTRLAEWEVLKIFSDTAEAVACMHYLRPPLLHRDLKIENVLISSPDCYKLCDFGSCSEVRPAATNSQERRLLEDDIQKNTTIQYRSPEMVDTTRRLPIDEKSDIWALGVLLYKLCYFTTPFESQGQMAILNAAYTFPPFPPYTDRTKRLIAVMLQENPKDRPNIYQLLAEVCAMRNTKVPIPDIYSRSVKAVSQVRSRPPSVGRDVAEPVLAFDDENTAKSAVVSEKEPMRRGRPVRQASSPELTASRGRSTATSGVDDIPMPAPAFEDDFTTKFPTLDELDAALVSTPRQVIQPQPRPSDQPTTVGDKRRDIPGVIQASSSTASRPAGWEVRVQQLAQKGEGSRQTTHSALDGPQRAGPVMVASPRHALQNGSQELRDLPRNTTQHLEAGFRPRPQVVNRSSQTSPKQRGQQTQTSPPKGTSTAPLSGKPRIADKPPTWQTFSGKESTATSHDVQSFATPAPVRARPLTIHVAPAAESRSSFAVPRPPSRPASAAESRASDVQPSESLESSTAAQIRRSASSGHGKHHKRPSLTQIGSFSGAAKTLVNGKFGEAFRKFESTGSKTKTQTAQSSEPLFVEEVDDLPDHITSHLRTTSARRSLSYGRAQATAGALHAASQQQENSNVDQSSYSVKEAMRRLKEKAAQPYEVKKTATGYGKYTDEPPTRSATVIPTTRVAARQQIAAQTPVEHQKHPARSAGGRGEDEDFEKRYPSLPFTV
ncbi:kinase-like domain-containing protein [Protomyces lactucae-debilis]|uniref:non-specific serine/threonine protein kinase n=1 Tax=Protomyces lactucae-debilis TaxID=2754530 RepID=A0A1Y2FDZ0_PROLT|nr:kinase-like domain-containing protein [Protomyces lactucae-debilis]ORY82148.1 kinase-like domain-containing protein [Protomyces lactucae-debilis]